MENTYPKFTPEMKKTHKILIPNMAPIQFRILAAAMEQQGYTCELLGNCGSHVAENGLKYVHNDTCYPALLVIGQFLDALESRKYDLDHTALVITQTGGGCRASNYIHLLRKALERAGFGQIPVASLNFSGLEKDSGFPMTVVLLRQLLASIYYGDLLVALRAQTVPYELHKGDADAMLEKWLTIICGHIRVGRGYSNHEIRSAKGDADAMLEKWLTSRGVGRGYSPSASQTSAGLCHHSRPPDAEGEGGRGWGNLCKIFPWGNNDLEKFLESQDCEVNLPGLMGFVQYCCYNPSETAQLYGGVFVKSTCPA